VGAAVPALGRSRSEPFGAEQSECGGKLGVIHALDAPVEGPPSGDAGGGKLGLGHAREVATASYPCFEDRKREGRADFVFETAIEDDNAFAANWFAHGHGVDLGLVAKFQGGRD
jgi:hypothetical protein